MIAATETGIIGLLRAAANIGLLGYDWHTLETYPDDFDQYLKDKGQLRTPAAWSVFLGIEDGQDNQDDEPGWHGRARFALVVAAQNLRNETATRHGGPDQASEPGSYQLALDAVRVISRHDLGFLVEPLHVNSMRLVARTPELRTQKLSLMALELTCRLPAGQFADAGNPADFLTAHLDWDVPTLGNVAPPLPAADPDAEDLVELPQ